MESRLRKPKLFFTKKTLETTKCDSESSSMKNPSRAATTNVTTAAKTDTKSIGKLNRCLTMTIISPNANKSLPKPLRRCSRSFVSTPRPVKSKIVVKRLGAVTTATTNTTTTTKTTTERAVNTVTGGVKPATKPSKWDLKGRLALSEAKLSSLKEKHKECAQLEIIVNELRSKETSNIAKIKELENIIFTLDDQLVMAKKNYEDSQKFCNEIAEDLRLSEKALLARDKALRAIEETCDTQKIIINEYASKFEDMRNIWNVIIDTNFDSDDKIHDLRILFNAI